MYKFLQLRIDYDMTSIHVVWYGSCAGTYNMSSFNIMTLFMTPRSVVGVVSKCALKSMYDTNNVSCIQCMLSSFTSTLFLILSIHGQYFKYYEDVCFK